MGIIKVAVLGNGKVGKPLIELLEKQLIPAEIVAVAIKDENKVRAGDLPYCSLEDALEKETDIYVDCLPYKLSIGEQLLNLLKNGKTLISCSKEFVEKHAKKINEICKESGGSAYFNSIPASPTDTGYKYLNLTHKNIHRQDIDDLLEFRGADGEVTAKFVYQDIARVNHKLYPEQDQARVDKANRAREQKKAEFQKKAEAMNVELEPQPCGIDPEPPKEASS